MRKLVFLFFLFGAFFSFAQHLEVNRTQTHLRQIPKSGAEIVLGGKVVKGDLLELLDSAKQTNGYYHARIPGTGLTGWIYRSLVSRKDGIIPTFNEGASGADVYVVDVGAGLGCIIRTPSGKFIIYDGGNSDYVNRFLNDLHDPGGEVDLVIVSHTDSDHWRSIDEIVRDYEVKEAIYTSYRPGGLITTIQKGIDALDAEAGIEITDLANDPIPHGEIVYEEGDFSLRLISGFGEHNPVFADDIGSSSSKLRNAASIVIKLEYKDRSVLFTGDVKGLKDCDKAECDCEMKCISTEKYLLDSLQGFLDSDVILAAHHGARNASCPDFIEAVDPEYVIFSAGNTHKHPHKLTADNYMNFGVPAENMLRTDLGKIPEDKDANECNNEWVGVNKGRTDKDGSFDDHIRIQITDRGRLNVGYVNE